LIAFAQEPVTAATGDDKFIVNIAMASSTSRPATPPLSRTASFANVQQYPVDNKFAGQPDVEAREGLLEAREEGAADARLQEISKPSQGNSSGSE
jgi:hypothetical protein